jgi:hypothetical protein
MTFSRRKETIKKLKCKEEDVWGEGCLIFAPCSNATLKNLKCRYLPKLEQQSITTFNIKPAKKNSTTSKTIINQLIVDAIIIWKDLQYYTEEEAMYLPLIKYLSKNKITDENMVIQTEVIAKQVLNLNAYKVGEMLRKLEIAGLLTYQVTGKHRLRSWIVSADCSYE